MSTGDYTRIEIQSQPDVWRSVLQEHQNIDMASKITLDNSRQYFLVTGCGSTYYLSVIVATILRKLGFRASAFPAAEIIYFPETLPPGEPILLTISRSGTTTETLRAVEKFRKEKRGQLVFTVTTQPESTLAKESDFVIAASQAKEDSVAQTRSFTSMLLLSQILSGEFAKIQGIAKRLQTLPTTLDRLFSEYSSLACQIGEDLSINRFFFLGGGPLYGLACEAMLKTKEMTCSWAEAYHPLEFRHGPMSVIDESSLVVCFVSDSQKAAEVKVLQDMKRLGARTLVLTEDSSGFDPLEMNNIIPLKSGLNEWDRGVIYLPLIQWIAYNRAIAKGLDPDHPTNLSAVIELNDE